MTTLPGDFQTDENSEAEGADPTRRGVGSDPFQPAARPHADPKHGPRYGDPDGGDHHHEDGHLGDVSTLAPFIRRSPRISQADVFRAADELLVEGNRPTIDRVRMRLGRGSPNTINDHLDAWWAKLGSRLRDLPGREFPQLPERVGHALQLVWNEALDGARETLHATLLEREQAIAQREQALEAQARELGEQERAAAMRAAGLEESLGLIREQLSAAGRRSDALEKALQDRDAECTHQRSRMESLEKAAAELRAKLDTVTAQHQAERTKLEERYSAAEDRWLTEVDRARQVVKEATKDHERQLKDLRGQLGSLQSDRDRLRHELADTRSDLKTATAVREQLEERLRLTERLSNSQASNAKAKPKSGGKAKRPIRRGGGPHGDR